MSGAGELLAAKRLLHSASLSEQDKASPFSLGGGLFILFCPTFESTVQKPFLARSKQASK
jgi:hypothetical protein